MSYISTYTIKNKIFYFYIVLLLLIIIKYLNANYILNIIYSLLISSNIIIKFHLL